MTLTYSRSILALSILFLLQSQTYAIERINLNFKNANQYVLTSSISANGRFIAFHNETSKLVNGNEDRRLDVFVYDSMTKEIEQISRAYDGTRANAESREPSISADGRFVAFSSFAKNLIKNDTTNKFLRNTYVHDRATGVTRLVSKASDGTQGNGESSLAPSLSADGRYIAFTSTATNLVSGDVDRLYTRNVFVHDQLTGKTQRIDVSSTGTTEDAEALYTSISADGRYVAFGSGAKYLVDGDVNDKFDIFVHDRKAGKTELVSKSNSGIQANDSSMEPSISANGRFVAFLSRAGNLIDGDFDDDWQDAQDLFVHDRKTGTTEKVNVSTSGYGDGNLPFAPSISGNGRYISFIANSDSFYGLLDDDELNYNRHVFVHDRIKGVTDIVSTVEGWTPFHSDSPISANGGRIAFWSSSDKLVANDNNDSEDIFITENTVINNNNLSVIVHPTSAAVNVGKKVRFRATFTNHSDKLLTKCKARIIKPFVNGKRRLRFYTWPLNVSNPKVNAAIDLAPGEKANISLVVKPLSAMRDEVKFRFICNGTKATNIPFENTVHLTSKTQPLSPEDHITLKNGNGKTELVIDRKGGINQSAYRLKVKNTATEQASVNLSTWSRLPKTILSHSRLCETKSTQNFKCTRPAARQIQVDLKANQTKNIWVFAHAKRAISKKQAANQIHVEARDQVGALVAKNSIGISTIN